MKFERIVQFLKGVVQGPEAFKRAPQPTRAGKSHEAPDQHTEAPIEKPKELPKSGIGWIFSCHIGPIFC